MLHQATTLSQDKEGRFVHVFSIHTDISHLTSQSVEEVSFLNIRGGKSYLNMPSKNGRFEPENHSYEANIKDQLSKRELEITKLIAEGLNAEEIGERLFISSHTVRTHRKNILKKTDSKNTIQLVARCVSAGIIAPDL
jgi:DNA-binding CsgD family transcriptional regulator